MGLRFSYLVDLTEHLSDFNLRRQRIKSVYQIKLNSLTHFSSFAAHKLVICAKYAASIFDFTDSKK